MKNHLSVTIGGMIALVVLLALVSAPRLTQARASTAGEQPRDPAGVNTIAPGAIPIQGRLTDASGKPLNGTYAMVFKLYETEAAVAPLCLDILDSVSVQNGLFNTYLDHCYDNLSGQKVWLGIQVGSDPEMLPRQVIFPVPYALSLVPGVRMDTNIAHPFSITTSSTTGRAVEGIATGPSGVNYGVSGSSNSTDGAGGYFYNGADGTGVSGISVAGVAISAGGTGVITSSAKSYIWISGNGVRPFYHNDPTGIDMDSTGGAVITRGAKANPINVILPITIPGQLYGQDIRVTALDVYWKGQTGFDVLSAVLLRRQVNICNQAACYASLVNNFDDHTCVAAQSSPGCVQNYPTLPDNVLTDSSGILYLTLELYFNSDTSWIQIGGVRLTIEHD